jgi:iron-sulfur cluster assembly protein
MIELTEHAISKIKEILEGQDPQPKGVRIAVVGGGCSGFNYSMNFEEQAGVLDKTLQFDGLTVFVDQVSLQYLEGAKVDYVEALEGAGFKFDNPNVRTTCGCGQSFDV